MADITRGVAHPLIFDLPHTTMRPPFPQLKWLTLCIGNPRSIFSLGLLVNGSGDFSLSKLMVE